MSAMTAETIIKWLESDEAQEADLVKVAAYLIDAEYAADTADVINGDEADEIFDEMSPGLLEEARAHLQRRDWSEALHTLAAALGRDFDALETIPLGSP